MFLIPFHVDYEYEGRPWATMALAALCVAGTVAFRALAPEAILDLALFTDDLQVHQFLTSTFLHVSVLHLLGNLLYLLPYGRLVEAICGRGRFLLVFFVGALGGDLLWLLYVAGESRPSYAVGASGGVSALLGFALVFAPRAEVRFIWRRHDPDDASAPSVPAWLMLVGWLCVQLLLSLDARLTGTGVMAHLGAFATGVGLAFLLRAEFLRGTPFHVERLAAGGSVEGARLARTARFWHARAEASRARRRTVAEERGTPGAPAPPAAPPSAAAWSASGADDEVPALLEEHPAARPSGFEAPAPVPGTGAAPLPDLDLPPPRPPEPEPSVRGPDAVAPEDGIELPPAREAP